MAISAEKTGILTVYDAKNTKKLLNTNKKSATNCYTGNCAFNLSGYQDSNLGPPAPKAGALPDCATSRTCYFRMRYIPKFGWTPGFEPGTLPILIGMRYRTALHPEKESPLARACGWGGIRTRGTSFPVRRFSKPVVSATHPPIRGLIFKRTQRYVHCEYLPNNSKFLFVPGSFHCVSALKGFLPAGLKARTPRCISSYSLRLILSFRSSSDTVSLKIKSVSIIS